MNEYMYITPNDLTIGRYIFPDNANKLTIDFLTSKKYRVKS